MNNRSAQFLRKRKFYLVVPLLVLPFVTLAFWAMGGGREKTDDAKAVTGLNLQLPDAKLKDDKNFDKLSFYNLADKDSLKHVEDVRNDPNYKPDTNLKVLELVTKPEYKSVIQSPFGNNGVDANEQKIYKKISELRQQINTPTENKAYQNSPPVNNVNEQFTQQVDKLQGMMQTMNDKPEKDTEIEQMGSMLDKIITIQHPDRIKDIKEKSIKNKQQVFSVQTSSNNEGITLLQLRSSDTIKRKARNNFYDGDNSLMNEAVEDHAIEAVVHETQTLVSGATIKLRLSNDIYINGILIPKGNFIYGIASLESERLSVNINAVRYQNNLLPVALQVYDMDGLAGIHIPGSISRDVAKQSSEQSLQNIDITTLDPSLAAQAANTGIQAAKTLLAKKVKLVKVTLKAGYKVLLKDNNKNN
jgi:conjugative transposon TraM protein